MTKLNNKGQMLVMFIILMPVFLILILFVVDIANASYQRQALNNICYLSVSYALEKIDDGINENDIKNYVKLNDSDIDYIDVTIEPNSVILTLKKDVDGIMSKIIDLNIYEVTSTYVGNKDNDNINIERVK